MGISYKQARELGLGDLVDRLAGEAKAKKPVRPPPRPYEPWPRRWTMEIPGWRPAFASELKCHPFKAARLKKRDAHMLQQACLAFGVLPAFTRRRVTLTIANAYSSFPDDDAPWKSFLDALKQAEALVDDSRQWCEVVHPPTYERGPKRTTITLEDI